MSLFSRLFGGASSSQADPEPVEYKGCRIYPEPEPAGQQFRLAARIEKEIDGETRTHRLIRADTLQDRETAVSASVAKARQVIDEQGDELFRRSG